MVNLQTSISKPSTPRSKATSGQKEGERTGSGRERGRQPRPPTTRQPASPDPEPGGEDRTRRQHKGKQTAEGEGNGPPQPRNGKPQPAREGEEQQHGEQAPDSKDATPEHQADSRPAPNNGAEGTGTNKPEAGKKPTAARSPEDRAEATNSPERKSQQPAQPEGNNSRNEQHDKHPQKRTSRNTNPATQPRAITRHRRTDEKARAVRRPRPYKSSSSFLLSLPFLHLRGCGGEPLSLAFFGRSGGIMRSPARRDISLREPKNGRNHTAGEGVLIAARPP